MKRKSPRNIVYRTRKQLVKKKRKMTQVQTSQDQEVVVVNVDSMVVVGAVADKAIVIQITIINQETTIITVVDVVEVE